MNRHAALFALVSAALFGLSTPAAKALLAGLIQRCSRGCFTAARALALPLCGALQSPCWKTGRQVKRR